MDDTKVIAEARRHMMHRGGSTIRREDVRHAERMTGQTLTVAQK